MVAVVVFIAEKVEDDLSRNQGLSVSSALHLSVFQARGAQANISSNSMAVVTVSFMKILNDPKGKSLLSSN